jgi:hypothetical protein
MLFLNIVCKGVIYFIKPDQTFDTEMITRHLNYTPLHETCDPTVQIPGAGEDNVRLCSCLAAP